MPRTVHIPAAGGRSLHGRLFGPAEQRPGVAGTVRFDDIRRHYYLTHGSINPSRIVAVAPDEDWDAPHGRG